jgi:hypothetical protein
MDKEALLSQMTGMAITNGWDVVCAMSAKNISALFKDKYDKGEASGTLYKIKFEEPFELGVISVDFKVGPPLISFIESDSKSCTLQLEIKEGEADLMDTSRKVVDSQKIPSGPDDTSKYFITCTIPLTTIEGRIKNGHDVVIDFNQTKVDHIDLKFSDTIKEYAKNGLKNYFANTLEKEDWSLGTLIYDENPELVQLTPKYFEFATSVPKEDKTHAGCLMLFISTEKDKKQGTANELTGKDGRLYIPYPDDHSAALIISNEFFFKQILLPQMPENPAKWEFKEGETKEGKSKLVAGYCALSGGTIKYNGRNDGSGHVRWKIDKYELKFAEGDPALSLTEKSGRLCFQWGYSWQVHWVCSIVTGQSISSNYGDTSLNLQVKNPDISITVSEPNQVITFKNEAEAEIQGPDKPDDFWSNVANEILGGNMADNIIKSNLCDQLPKLNIQFKGVNVFAVSNLLFPADHIITYDSDGVYTPGDLVIFGNTKKKI